jgi:hypothetical protein
MTGPSPRSSIETRPERLVALSLVIGGLITIAVAVFLGATIEPFLYAIALVAVIDFAFAWAFGTGRIGPAAQRRRDAEASGDVSAVAADDPSYNPYARED